MDRGAWQATIHGVERVGHDLATKLPAPLLQAGTGLGGYKPLQRNPHHHRADTLVGEPINK